MERILRIYLPSTALTFTATVFCTCAMNLFGGYESLSNRWVLQLLAYILLVELMDALLGRVEFKSYGAYFFAEIIPAYTLLLVFGYFGSWFAFTAEMLVRVTVLFLLIGTGVHVYFCGQGKRNAKEINRILQEKSNE